MKSIKQLRLLYGLPLLLSLSALVLAVSGGRTLYAVLALILLVAEFFTLQFFSTRVKRSVAESLASAAEGATLTGALFSTLWTTFAAALLISIKRH